MVWRPAPGGAPELVVIHRPRYDDWSLPKGKLDPGESFEDAALREVEEEIGVRCRLGAELPPVAYRDNKGRAKVVRYWLMEAVDGCDVRAQRRGRRDALGRRRRDADALLSYQRDRSSLREAAERRP